MGPKLIASIGVVLTIVGVLLLFWCGTPFAPRSRGQVNIILETDDAAAARKDRIADVGSWGGLILSVGGSVLQVVAIWL